VSHRRSEQDRVKDYGTLLFLEHADLRRSVARQCEDENEKYRHRAAVSPLCEIPEPLRGPAVSPGQFLGQVNGFAGHGVVSDAGCTAIVALPDN